MSGGGYLPCTDVLHYNLTQLESFTDYVIGVAVTNKETRGANESVAIQTEIGSE